MNLVQFGENVREEVNFICNGCGKCVSLCPVEAMTLVSSNDPAKQAVAGRQFKSRYLEGLIRRQKNKSQPGKIITLNSHKFI